ncbi:MAG TPA: hypothetical protein VNH21_06755 [Steroidobacteraceae bacterium]|nr:hypothetical protein [Steroidobacteraceae bacterium]
MANEQLDSFLASETQAATPEPAPREAPEPRQEAPEPKAEATRPPELKAAEKPPEDDAEPPQALDGEPVIPRRAYEDERRKRQDWKEKAARLEGELAAYKAQQEQARQPQPEQMPPLAPIDPAQDPVGFTARLQQVLLNERLNNSEERLREKIGDEKLNEYVNEFKQLAQRDQTLFGKLYSQTNPYAWMTREVDRLRHLREVGDDPSAYRARIEAEARAKWEAEAAAKPPPPPVSPAAGMQPSLATARSVAGRTASTWTGEPSLEEVLAPVQNRRSANGQFRRF